jgi:hypothetical protein
MSTTISNCKVLLWNSLSYIFYRHEARSVLKLLDKRFLSIEDDWC